MADYQGIKSILGEFYDRLKTRFGGGVPIGTIFAWPSENLPLGYISVRGQNLSITEYQELYDIFGDYFNNEDTPEGYFKLPDLREVEIVGAGENVTYDIATHDPVSIGEFRDDQLQGHKHDDAGHTHGIRASSSDSAGNTNDYGNNHNRTNTTLEGYANLGLPTKFDEEYGEPRNGKTTHGKQVGFNYIIKAKEVYKNFPVPSSVTVDDAKTSVTNVWTAQNISDKLTSIYDTINNLFNSGSNENGSWLKLTNGLTLQWGKKTNNLSKGTITLPIPFTSENYSVTTTMRHNSGNSILVAMIENVTSTSFDFYSVYNSGMATEPFDWFAIGS